MVSEKVFLILCTAIIGNLKYFLYHYDGKYMHEILKKNLYKSLDAAFIALFLETTMTLTIGIYGN